MPIEAGRIVLNRAEAATCRWALRYVAQGLEETHKQALLKNEGLTETGFSERAERLKKVADQIEAEFDLTIFE